MKGCVTSLVVKKPSRLDPLTQSDNVPETFEARAATSSAISHSRNTLPCNILTAKAIVPITDSWLVQWRRPTAPARTLKG